MNTRRSFLSTLLAIPAAAKAALSKVGHEPLLRKGDTIPISFCGSYTDPSIQSGTKIIKELWVDRPAGTVLWVSLDGGPWTMEPVPGTPFKSLRVKAEWTEVRGGEKATFAVGQS